MSPVDEELLRSRIRADEPHLGATVVARLLEHTSEGCDWAFDTRGAVRCTVHDLELAPPAPPTRPQPAAVLVCSGWDHLPVTARVATGAVRRRCEACRPCAVVLTPPNAPVHLPPGGVEMAERLYGAAYAADFAELAGMPACEVLL